MTNERIAAIALGSELGFIVFWLVPHTAALSLMSTLLVVAGSIALVTLVARGIAARFGIDDPWREIGLYSNWDLELAEICA
ncbi:hypothetical protein [Aeromicrobium duanguangcaii]|uniref:Uncharacterized protein n=1 Tax=Aeromicrobium duanguangcaii TaxID=2968086 RepID=A0ABY5KCD5_9ACTN|nr:hypothetical protein [Aeromicrobium duanguangcaii]MCD9154636.1 hypothetical protein [Aeromicrobium duanguangcaii]MCL3838758.1 hypothetical protein [Aeromicrobium duanguangcaii]UUI67949.1 hypothetical protein NP095_12165 [Aeromicrobium duanguangcaii]